MVIPYTIKGEFNEWIISLQVYMRYFVDLNTYLLSILVS